MSLGGRLSASKQDLTYVEQSSMLSRPLIGRQALGIPWIVKHTQNSNYNQSQINGKYVGTSHLTNPLHLPRLRGITHT